MSKENLEQFIQQISASEELQTRIGDKIDTESLIALGAEHGCEFTAEDLAEHAELSDEELDGVAGGGIASRAVTRWRLRRFEKLARKLGVASDDGIINYGLDATSTSGSSTEYWDDGSGDPTKVN